jgi:hypothetical protein
VARISGIAAIVAVAAMFAAARSQPTEAAMAAAATALLSTLDEAQQSKIKFPFEAEERFNWHFIPRERQGLPLKAMDERQRNAAFALLRTGLSAEGYSKAETIRGLEVVLREMESSARRDPELYFFTIFGEPGGSRWGWRYEGHHISQNWTIVNGKAIATTPAFLGANPADLVDPRDPRRSASEDPRDPRRSASEIPRDPRRSASQVDPRQSASPSDMRPLGDEEDLAWALLESLSDAQRREAVVAAQAPNDILTSNTRKASILENGGLAGSSLSDTQRAMLMKLIEEHASVQAPSLAQQRLAKVRGDGVGNIRFAWMGSTTRSPGNGHYYRVQGKSFLIEYDNVQNGANHHHTVWRDFDGDFGVDLLAEHYASDPHHARR